MHRAHLWVWRKISPFSSSSFQTCACISSPGVLLKAQFTGSPRDFDSEGLGWGRSRICIFYKFPSDVDEAGLGTHLKNHFSRVWILFYSQLRIPGIFTADKGVRFEFRKFIGSYEENHGGISRLFHMSKRQSKWASTYFWKDEIEWLEVWSRLLGMIEYGEWRKGKESQNVKIMFYNVNETL